MQMRLILAVTPHKQSLTSLKVREPGKSGQQQPNFLNSPLLEFRLKSAVLLCYMNYAIVFNVSSEHFLCSWQAFTGCCLENK